MASLAAEELAASALLADLVLALLVVFAENREQLELRLPLGRAKQFVFVNIHALRNVARCIFVFRLRNVVVEHVLPIGRS